MPQRITEEKKRRIKELQENGYSYDNICKITKSSKKSVSKILKKTSKFNPQLYDIPRFLKKTKYPGYYVTECGEIWTEWHRNPSHRGAPRKMNQNIRGGVKKEDRYLSVNISIKDENLKTIKQIRYYSHRLIAETLLENPNQYKEVDHVDSNKHNNHISNLRWVSKKENMRHAAKAFLVEDIRNGKIYRGVNLRDWVIENWNWISLRTKTKNPIRFAAQLRSHKILPKIGLKLIR